MLRPDILSVALLFVSSGACYRSVVVMNESYPKLGYTLRHREGIGTAACAKHVAAYIQAWGTRHEHLGTVPVIRIDFNRVDSLFKSRRGGVVVVFSYDFNTTTSTATMILNVRVPHRLTVKEESEVIEELCFNDLHDDLLLSMQCHEFTTPTPRKCEKKDEPETSQ